MADNIAYGLAEQQPTDAAPLEGEDFATLVADAARTANAHDFVVGMEGGGYAASVGKRGGRLSGGQRARVCLARAVAGRRPVLLLDEYTAALDATSERVVGEALARVAEDRTVISIAHRLVCLCCRLAFFFGGGLPGTSRNGITLFLCCWFVGILFVCIILFTPTLLTQSTKRSQRFGWHRVWL